ncbi:MAG: ribosomal protein S18-alanine N-acetyltransferase [Desulfobulbaceae bacterium]|nr:ribosomal protein S18-alanine N-acetyltransferase [Desulfobulbaceae bacterium]
MITRPLTITDNPAVYLLEKQNLTGPWTETMVKGELTNQYSLGYIALTHDDHPCGFILARLVVGEGEIIRFAVASEQRRQGIGTSLLLALLDELFTRRAEQCFLEVRAGNTPALRLYNSIGFTRAGLRKGYYHHPEEDGLILKKDLSAGCPRPGAPDENNSRFGYQRQTPSTSC